MKFNSKTDIETTISLETLSSILVVCFSWTFTSFIPRHVYSNSITTCNTQSAISNKPIFGNISALHGNAFLKLGRVLLVDNYELLLNSRVFHFHNDEQYSIWNVKLANPRPIPLLVTEMLSCNLDLRLSRVCVSYNISSWVFYFKPNNNILYFSLKFHHRISNLSSNWKCNSLIYHVASKYPKKECLQILVFYFHEGSCAYSEI